MGNAPPGRIWLLYLVPAVRFGRPLTGLAIFTLLSGLYWAVGIFDSELLNRTAPAFFCVILAYIVPIFHFITERTEQAFRQLSPALDLDPERVQEWGASIAVKSRGWHAVVLSAGTVAWIAHCTLVFESIEVMLGTPVSLAIAFGSLLVWTVMTSVIFALVENARLFNRLAQFARIDLLDTTNLRGFAQVAVISTLAMIIAQACFPIMWLGSGVNLVTMRASIPGLIGTGVPMVFLFMLPIYPIHRALAAAKVAELERIGRLLEQARGAVRGAPPKDPELIARITPLLAYRREVAQVPEWPFDNSLVTRLAFYLIIPPVTWVGAALVEKIVEAFL